MGVPELDIAHLRASTILCGKNLQGCYTADPRVADFFEFKKRNPSLVLLALDKTQDFVFLTNNEYHKKMENLLKKSDFEKN